MGDRWRSILVMKTSTVVVTFVHYNIFTLEGANRLLPLGGAERRRASRYAARFDCRAVPFLCVARSYIALIIAWRVVTDVTEAIQLIFDVEMNHSQ
jgi:hypothetical protein